MPRGPRLEAAGGLHHITAKSPSGRLLFPDDRAKQFYLQLLAREVRERGWLVLTFCLLSNHLHILVLTPSADLGRGFKRLHEDFARYLNRTHGATGHAFGQRFHNKPVRDDRHAIGCLRYIARNPVAAGIVSQAEHWRWSAHRALAGLDFPPQLLAVEAALGLFDDDPECARDAYQSLVATGDQALLGALARPNTDRWLVDAVDDYAIDIAEVAAFFNVSPSRAYRRLKAARATVGTVPGVASAQR